MYGCNAAKWNKALLEAFLEEHPSAKAVAPTNSWEKGVLCPSDEWTWKFVGAYAREFATAAGFDGLVVTFWDDYGLNCKCKRCKKNGMDTFGRQVAAMVKCLDNAITPLGKKLIVRTWASGAPHWLGDEWVHAPGYAGEADAAATWNEAMKEASGNVIFQTKVYNCDCQPDAPFSNLLGKSGGREEFAEWQITGQTVGLQWLPAAVVKHTKGTFERVKKMANVDGVCLYAGGYNNPGYEALDDVMNSVNLHVWRQLSWNPDEELDDLLREWALVRHGTGDADKIAEAMALSEDAAVASFSPLGLGAPTESRFAKTVSRREDLLRYTNRHYLPDGHAALIPSDENIARVAAQKDRALAATRRMEELFSTCNDVPQDVRKEFLMRTEWLRTHLECSRALDVALWNFRMVRYLSEMGLGDAKYAAAIDGQFGELRKLHKSLFAHDADAKVSFYPDGFGGRKIALDSPVPLMRDIAERAKKCMEIVAGPQD
ncbi:MAG: hypothetical protein IJ802_06235 [Kiritimatiellae bacterium]|nr:hypothetical protein [Kiritimatiellia bacterium]